MKLIKLFFALLCLIPAMQGQAQTIDKYFVDMPAILMPGLESKMRLELTEYYKSERRDSIRNSYGYQVKLLTLDTLNSYISVQAASNTRFEMKTMLRPESSVLIAVIHTVCGPICSSYIHFYDKGWNEIKIDFPKLNNHNWLKTPESIVDGEKVEDMLKATFIELTFKQEKNAIVARNHSIEYLNLESGMLLEPYLKKENIIIAFENNGWHIQ